MKYEPFSEKKMQLIRLFQPLGMIIYVIFAYIFVIIKTAFQTLKMAILKRTITIKKWNLIPQK